MMILLYEVIHHFLCIHENLLVECLVCAKQYTKQWEHVIMMTDETNDEQTSNTVSDDIRSEVMQDRNIGNY
jgi:hypothetical protein